jgi:tetratricopeptide (TPR) repeat protein
MADNNDIQGTLVASPVRSGGSVPTHRGVFSREGEFWRLAYDGESFGLKHSKGLDYIAQLLRFPGTEFHALDLVGGNVGTAGTPDDISAKARSSLPQGEDALASAGIHVGGLGDAGEMLDDEAKAQYRRRVDELREELDEAKRLGNIERAEQAEAEIDMLTAELSRAVGLGGRNRRAASASERARQSVTHAIKSTLERIAEKHAQLGALLSGCVKTGNTCVYYPDPAMPVAWEFGSPGEQHSVSSAAISSIELKTLDNSALDALLSPAILAPTRRNLTPIVGRETELAQLWALAQRALNGYGAIVLLAGGPGVGKTRLSLEFLAQASQRGFRCFSGRCYERDEPHPLMPFVEIIEAALAQAPSVEQFRELLSGNAAELAQIAPSLRRVAPDLPEPRDPSAPQVRRYFFQSVFDFVARMSQTRPLLLVLDDVHWADESTLALINFLANRVAQVPLLILVAYRDGALDANPYLTRTLEELLKLGVRPIRLRGLERGAVALMVGRLSRQTPPQHLVDLVFEETQGNPFFVEEVFSYLVEEGKIFDAAGNFRSSFEQDESLVPDNVRLVLGRRLGRLSDDAREVLSAASVIGRSFSFRLLAAVLDRTDPDALFAGLEEAQRAGFIISSSLEPEAPFAFSHELVRQTLLTGISQPRQQRLHLKIAQAFEKLYGMRIDERAAEVAHHFLKAGPFAGGEKAAYYLSLAGQSSLRAGALEDARRSLSAALRYGQREPISHAQTLANLASAERGLGDWGAAIAHLHDSLGLYANAGDLRSVGRVVFEMVEGFIWTGHFDEVAKIAQPGLEHLRSDENIYRSRLLPVSGLIHALRGELSSAMKAFDEALASPSVTPFLARVLAYRSFSYLHLLQLREALEDGNKSIALSNGHKAPWTHALALALVMRTLYHLGKPEQALKIGIELEPLARGAGHLAALSSCHSIQAWAEFGREPDLAVLDKRMREAVNFDRERGLSWFLAQSLMQMSEARFFAGDWDSVRSIVEKERAADPRGPFASLGTAMLMRLAAYSGDRDTVLELVEQTRSHLPKLGPSNTIGRWSLLMVTVESLAMIADQGRAAELYAMVRELLRCGVVCMYLTCRFSETIAGVAAGAAGDWNAAEQHFRVALRQATDFPHRLEEAEVQRFHAMMLLQRNETGGRERAREMLVKSIESYERIAMPRHLELARSLLAKAV